MSFHVRVRDVEIQGGLQDIDTLHDPHGQTFKEIQVSFGTDLVIVPGNYDIDVAMYENPVLPIEYLYTASQLREQLVRAEVALTACFMRRTSLIVVTMATLALCGTLIGSEVIIDPLLALVLVVGSVFFFLMSGPKLDQCIRT